VSKLNTTYKYTSHISFKVPAFILKTSASFLVSMSSATAICKRSETHRNGNLNKGGGEAVKSDTKGTITF